MRLGLLALMALALPLGVLAADPDTAPGATGRPVRERIFRTDDHGAWTLQKGEAAVPLAVVPVGGRTAVALGGAWIVLGPDLEFQPGSIDFLGPDRPAGSPWAQAVAGALVTAEGSPGSLAVLYPDAAVVVRQPGVPDGLSQFAASTQGFFWVSGRKTAAAARFDQAPQGGQPLPFFPSDLTAAADGTLWASDSLQARPWRQEGGFWRPLDLPQAPGRLASLAPWDDSTGYFAAGPGWVGAFSSDGTAWWVKETDLAGNPLPRDLKVRAGNGHLYLWSAQARSVWSWAWTPQGLAGTAGTPGNERLAAAVRAEADRLEALGGLPEARGVLLYGVQAAQAVLQTKPFDQTWTRLQDEFSARAQALRTRIVGSGSLTLEWDAPWQLPLASWVWEPDAELADVKAWRAAALPFWEGRPWDRVDFGLAAEGELTPWPGAQDFRQGPLVLPSWMNLEFRPEGTDEAVHWARVALPVPPLPYPNPTE